MKLRLFFLTLLLLLSRSQGGQFPDYPAADLVLGAPDFDTPGSTAADGSSIEYPHGIGIDPVTGKVFVASYNQHRILRFGSYTSLSSGASAEAVIGQSDLTSVSSGLSQSRLNKPVGIAFDAQGRLWVVDSFNNRVLMFENAGSLDSGANANLVLGQDNFTSDVSGTSMNRMYHPINLFVDSADNLWVCDYGNHRVLKFAAISSLTNGAAASVVIGGGSPGTSDVLLNYPSGVHVDASGNLWIVEHSGNRVVGFGAAASVTNGAAANKVFGQTNFTSSSQNTTASTMRVPGAITTDGDGTLWVADLYNNRILAFSSPATKENGASADLVIGQMDFFSGGAGLSAQQMNQPSIGLTFDPTGRLWVSDSQNNRVIRFSPEPSPPVDQRGPSLSVVSKVPRVTTQSRIRILGKANDPSGVSSVRYRVNRGGFHGARGTVKWNFTAKLKKGRNAISIVAWDVPGNPSMPKTVRTTRR